MPTAIGYVRVSTEDQATEGVSLDAQRARIGAWCQANGYELKILHEDAGLSGGRSDNRPGLFQALQDACACRGSALVVYSLSRLARSTKDTLAIADRLDAAGADLVSLSERIDTTSAAGRMVFRMLAVLSEFERDQLAERVKSAMQHMKANGKRVGAVPFGFDLGTDGKTLVANATEQDAIEFIERLRKRGASLRKIAAFLEREGIETKKGRSRWTPRAVSLVLGRAS